MINFECIYILIYVTVCLYHTHDTALTTQQTRDST